MSEKYVYLNGRVLREDQATVSVLDRGLLYGQGFFETMRAYSGRVFRPGEHLARLQSSCEARGISFRAHPLADPIEAAKAIGELLQANGFGDAAVRLTITPGPSNSPPGEPTVLVTAKAFAGYSEELYRSGMQLRILPADLWSRPMPVARHKSTSLFGCFEARKAAGAGEDAEALWLSPEGYVAEGAVSNVFWVTGGRLRTPSLDCGILPGVTRAAIIELGKAPVDSPAANGLDGSGAWTAVEEVKAAPEQLLAATEVFLTNSLMEIMPVSSVTRLELAASPGTRLPTPGPVTQQLIKAYGRLVADELGFRLR